MKTPLISFLIFLSSISLIIHLSGCASIEKSTNTTLKDDINNSIVDGFYNNDINDEKVYLIDLGKLRWAKNVDVSIMQVLLKRIRTRDKINLFLEGYLKYFWKRYMRTWKIKH